MTTFEVKRGNTLRLECVVQAQGAPVDITGWTIESHLNAPGRRRVFAFAPVITDAAAGAYTMVAEPEVTRAWPLGSLSMDIRYTDAAGTVMSTSTAQLRVLEAETL